MTRTSCWALAAIAKAVVLMASPVAAQNTESFEWRGTIPAGEGIEVRGVHGDIEASAASGGEVEVRASKSGMKSDPRGVRIEVVRDAQGVLVCAVYPSPDARQPNRCAREGHGSNVRDNDVEVNFTVLVPAGARLVARTVNGEVRATGLTSDVEATTVNGKIEVATFGAAAAQSVNGDIEARLGRGTWSGSRAFETVNGSVTVFLPPDARLEVSGRSVTGELKSDFPLTIPSNRSWGPRSVHGTIGDGSGGKIEIQTVNGDVQIRRNR